MVLEVRKQEISALDRQSAKTSAHFVAVFLGSAILLLAVAVFVMLVRLAVSRTSLPRVGPNQTVLVPTPVKSESECNLDDTQGTCHNTVSTTEVWAQGVSSSAATEQNDGQSLGEEDEGVEDEGIVDEGIEEIRMGAGTGQTIRQTTQGERCRQVWT